MTAGDVVEQGAEGRCWRWCHDRSAKPLRRGEASRQQADGSTFDIALAAGDLAGEAQAGT